MKEIGLTALDFFDVCQKIHFLAHFLTRSIGVFWTAKITEMKESDKKIERKYRR
jgi:hypothetical protein